MECTTTNGERIVFDAGSGIRALGASIRDNASANNGNARHSDGTVHLFLTHRHFDHVIGLPYFLPMRPAASNVVLRCGNASVAETHELLATVLSPPLFVNMLAIANALRVEPCETNAPVLVDSNCTVHRFDARHNGGAAVFRIDDASGAAFAFAPDNELSYASSDEATVAWRASLAEQLRNVRVLVHDAMFVDGEIEKYAGWGHSSAQEATRFAMECNAGMLVLFHHHPDRTDNEVDEIVLACRALVQASGNALRIEAAYEGMALLA